jgi:hypothetical protein
MSSGYDGPCFYLHNPDPDEKFQDHNNYQYMPIQFDDFERMSVFAARIIINYIKINK